MTERATLGAGGPPWRRAAIVVERLIRTLWHADC